MADRMRVRSLLMGSTWDGHGEGTAPEYSRPRPRPPPPKRHVSVPCRVTYLQDGDDRVLGQSGIEQGRAFTFGEACLAGPAVQQAALVAAVAHADGEVAVAALAVVGAVGVLAAESAEVV